MTSEPLPTRWGAILVAFLAACTLALHQGKMPSAISLLRDEFALSLTAAGWLLSVYALVIAVAALGIGMWSVRVGQARFAIAGVALAGVGSAFAMTGASMPLLTIGRILEGGGWIIAAVSMPAIIGRLASDHDKPLALGLLGAFVPLGSGTMLLLAPALQAAGGWRLSWLVASLLSLLAATLLFRVCSIHRERLRTPASRGYQAVGTELRRPAAWCLAACFFCYSIQFVALTGFLPTMLQETSSLSLESASRWTAVIILANVIGNVLAGRLLQQGVRLTLLVAVSAAVSSAGAAVAYSGWASTELRLAGAFVFTGVSGMIPGAMFASAPRVASVPIASGIVIGLMLQASGLGQLAGPLLLASAVDVSGTWSAASLFSLSAGLLAIVAARRINVTR